MFLRTERDIFQNYEDEKFVLLKKQYNIPSYVVILLDFFSKRIFVSEKVGSWKISALFYYQFKSSLLKAISKSLTHKTKNWGNLMFPQGLEDTPFSRGVNKGKYSKWELCLNGKIGY